MREFTLRVGPGALVALKFPADLELQPSRVLAIEEIVHVDHRHVCAVRVLSFGEDRSGLAHYLTFFHLKNRKKRKKFCVILYLSKVEGRWLGVWS